MDSIVIHVECQECIVSPKVTQGWKDMVLGEKKTHIPLEARKVINWEEEVEIVIIENFVDSVSTNLKLCMIGKFVSFFPSIEMARKWVSQK